MNPTPPPWPGTEGAPTPRETGAGEPPPAIPLEAGTGEQPTTDRETGADGPPPPAPRETGAGEPPPPTGPAYPGPAPSGAQAAVGAPGRNRRGVGPWIVAVVALALIGIAVIVGDWYARNLEMDRLVAGIESSEAAMIDGMDQVRVALQEDDAADGIAPETGEELQQIAQGAGAGVAAAAAQIEGVLIQPWHEDVLAARDTYLEHNAAWRDFLSAAAQEPQQWFAQDDAIETTWEAVGPVLRSAVPTPALSDIDRRVALILDDGGESEDGPALEAAA